MWHYFFLRFSRFDGRKWYEYVCRKPLDAVVRRDKMVNVSDTRKGGGRPKKHLIETINKDLSIL